MGAQSRSMRQIVEMLTTLDSGNASTCDFFS